MCSQLDEKMLLSYLSTAGEAEKNRLMNNAKRDYVDKHRDHAIIGSDEKGYKYQVGRGRQDRRYIKSKTLDGMYDRLYKLFKAAERPTVKQVFELSQQDARDNKGNSLNTIDRKRQFYEQWITDDFGSMAVEDVDEEYIGHFIITQIKALSAKQKALEGCKGVLNQIFNYAFRHHMIGVNPMLYVDLTNYYKYCAPSTKTADDEIYSPKQYKRLKDYFADDQGKIYEPHRLAVQMTCIIGDRVGELPALRWDDVDFGRGYIHEHRQQRRERLKGAPSRTYDLNYTKNERQHPKDGRYIPLTSELRKIVGDVKARQDAAGIRSEYLFCNADGTPISKGSLNAYYRRSCNKLGISPTGLHAMRKTYNSLVLLKVDISPAERAYLLGHSLRTNEEHYTYTRREQVDDIRLKLDRFEDAQRDVQGRTASDNIVSFEGKKKAIESAKFNGLKENN